MPQPDARAWTFEAIGTAWQVDTARPLSAEVETEVLRRIEGFDRSWSRFRPDSLVNCIASTAGEFVLPAEAGLLLGLYGELHDATQGAVNPLVGRTLADLGYDADYSFAMSVDPAPVPAWGSIDWSPPVLTTKQPVLLDVGAAGKGLLVDIVSSILLAHGFDQHTVDASGDLFHHGHSPLQIALEDPRDPTRAIGVVDLEPGWALCASATNRRAWGDGLHHVLDGRTGRPVEDIIATWVIADTAMWADGLATAHFFEQAPGCLDGRFEHQYVRMSADGRVEWSADLPGELFT